MTDCPCGTQLPYAGCCGRYHRGEAEPPTAETLMRARYSAFAVGDEAFLRRTWDTPPAGPLIDPSLSWIGLYVTDRTSGGLLDATGTVSFTARYQQDGKAGRLRENSRFVRRDGSWRYLGPA